MTNVANKLLGITEIDGAEVFVDSCEQQNYFDKDTDFKIILRDLSKIRTIILDKREDCLVDLDVLSEEHCQNIGMTIMGDLMQTIEDGFVKGLGDIAVLEKRALDCLNRNYPDLDKSEEHLDMAKFLTDIFLEFNTKPAFKKKIKTFLLRAKDKGIIYYKEADAMIEKLEQCEFNGEIKHEC